MLVLAITFVLCLPILTYGHPLQGKIVNGTNANPGEYPYAVSYRYFNDHNCGGSVIGEKWILTAAHCVHSEFDNESSILYGTVYVENGKRPQGKVINIKRSIKHPHYQPYDGFENDVGLVELEEPLSFDDFVQPVALPERFSPTPARSKATLVGWGYSETDGHVMEKLQKVNILVYSNEACAKAHEGLINPMVHLCAGVPEGGKGQCSGDSGGPLTVNGVQVGIVSWSVKPCTAKGYPGVFTRVSTFRDWIFEITGI